MRKYELVIVVRPSVKEADKKKLVETIKDWLKDFKITKEDDWGQKPLAYVIKKEVAGYYSLVQFEGEAGIEKEFEQRLLRNNDIIRHLLLRTK
jgi:small subunit ribosomal protein S6